MKAKRWWLNRSVYYILALLIQLALLMVVVLRFQSQFYLFYTASIGLSLLVVLTILNDTSNPAYKMAWIIPIMLLPFFGGLVYLLFGRTRLRSSMRSRLAAIMKEARAALPKDPQVMARLEAASQEAARQARYLEGYAFAPLYGKTSTTFLTTGEDKFDRLLAALRSAKHYIFLEYFIIEEGTMWNRILEVLRTKAASGLDVRVIYDDAGCMEKLPYRYDRKLEAMGIRCAIFNPVIPILNDTLNHRDHRKIAVVDGVIGFTGGINLADEYINEVERFGHWKDTAIELSGDAAWSMTVMFLSVWAYLRGEPQTTDGYLSYRPKNSEYGPALGDGFVQPFDDSPLDEERVGENVYLNLISRAQRYVYIATPYLIIDNEMLTALSLAAKSGVTVRIVTPHVPDKRYVHAVTRTYYRVLLDSGVEIYEYTPGFIHSKTFVSDDVCAVVGTINMDYRSLFLHFECGVWLWGTQSVLALRDDYLQILKASSPVTYAMLDGMSWKARMAGQFLRIFSPLM